MPQMGPRSGQYPAGNALNRLGPPYGGDLVAPPTCSGKAWLPTWPSSAGFTQSPMSKILTSFIFDIRTSTYRAPGIDIVDIDVASEHPSIIIALERQHRASLSRSIVKPAAAHF